MIGQNGGAAGPEMCVSRVHPTSQVDSPDKLSHDLAAAINFWSTWIILMFQIENFGDLRLQATDMGGGRMAHVKVLKEDHATFVPDG